MAHFEKPKSTRELQTFDEMHFLSAQKHPTMLPSDMFSGLKIYRNCLW